MSEIKVNKISPRTACGTTTLGDSGDTFTIPAGVTITNNGTQTGFGREGSVNWQTSIKTATFTATSGEGYFCNTSGGAFTVNLPSSPSVGDIVAIKDYGGSFDSNNLTIGRGGSNMNGFASDSVRNTANESLTLVYADATKGWLAVEEGTGYVGENFIAATGGTVSTSGNCKIHTFTGPGTFRVTSLADSSANNVVAYMVVAGGGGGAAGAGGAGGYREGRCNPITPYTASPLVTTGLTLTATDFPITVGSGGAQRTNGNNSVFSTITSTGGGGNPQSGPGSQPGNPGGSGGSGFQNNGSPASGGSGNTPPVSPSQGNNGGASNSANASGGGGGAGGAGGNGGPSTANGGAGVTSCISGSPVGRAGGGAGYDGSGSVTDGGGIGGGPGSPQPNGGDGSANTGGGGGGGQSFVGGAGGSGIVIIRYKYQ